VSRPAIGAALLALVMTATAHAEYSPHMEPGRLAVRHASWVAAEACRASWPAETDDSVLMHITLSRGGRVLGVDAEPSARAFTRCVRRRLRGETFSVTGPDRAERRWVVVSRYVFPRAPSAAP
jgi:hypothetical protein